MFVLSLRFPSTAEGGVETFRSLHVKDMAHAERAMIRLLAEFEQEMQIEATDENVYILALKHKETLRFFLQDQRWGRVHYDAEHLKKGAWRGAPGHLVTAS
jgi:hypothetical protein